LTLRVLLPPHYRPDVIVVTAISKKAGTNPLSWQASKAVTRKQQGQQAARLYPAKKARELCGRVLFVFIRARSTFNIRLLLQRFSDFLCFVNFTFHQYLFVARQFTNRDYAVYFFHALTEFIASARYFKCFSGQNLVSGLTSSNTYNLFVLFYVCS
jgi:hypothetical protein